MHQTLAAAQALSLSGGWLKKIIKREKKKVSSHKSHLHFKGQIKMWMDGIIAWLQSAGYWSALVATAMLWGVFSS